MKGFILLLVALSTSIVIQGQSLVSGKVADINGEAITGANIFIEGTYDGSSSDVNGLFSFKTNEKGQQILKATFIGYSSFSSQVNLENDVHIEIVLKEAINKMNAVVITAGSFESGTENKSEVLKPLDIVTTAGATADIPGALNTLPGTQTVANEGRLFVRGGDGYETTTFIDGMMVMDSYDPTIPNVATRSRFSPMMFKGASFSTGGYSAEYGQGLSSALILNSKDVALKNRSDFSFITVGLEAAHTQIWDESSISGKIGYFNLDPYFGLISQNLDWVDPPTSYDGNISFRQQLGNDGLLKAYTKVNMSDMTVNYDPIEYGADSVLTRLRNRYAHGNSSFKTILSDTWILRSGASYTYSKKKIDLDNDVVDELEAGWHLKTVAAHEIGEHFYLNFGGEIINREHSQDFEDFESGFENHFGFKETIISTFVEADIYVSNSLVARLGERLEYNTLSGDFGADPRLSLALKTGEDSQVSTAYGTFRQSPTKSLLRVNTKLASEKADHVILNYQLMRNRRTFRVEAYWKKYKELVKFDANSIFSPLSYNNDGTGIARGVDVFYRDNKSIKGADFWISYSFLDSERDYRDFPYEAEPVFTSKHNFSAVYKHFFTDLKSQVGLTWSFASGRPYNDPNKEIFNGERTPSYRNLSANISYLFRQNMIFYLSLTNLSGRENISGYEFSTVQNESGIYEGRPIISPAPRFLLVGFFLTLSKSGTVNQLPNL